MKKFLPLALLMFILVSNEGCKDLSAINENQKLLFQYVYTGPSGSTDVEGIIVDNSGNILLFNKPRKWNFPDKNGYLSFNQVTENLSQCRATGQKVPGPEMIKFSGYINNLASSKVSALKKISTGRGTFSYYCFTYEAGEGAYRQITIRTHGDTDCENLNFFSRKVVEWLNLLIHDLPVQHP